MLKQETYLFYNSYYVLQELINELNQYFVSSFFLNSTSIWHDQSLTKLRT